MRIKIGEQDYVTLINGFANDSFSENGYTFIAGMGFLPRDPVEMERRRLRKQGLILGAALLLLLFITSIISRITMVYVIILQYLGRLTGRPEYLYQLIILSIPFFAAFFFYTGASKLPIRAALQKNRMDVGMTVSACFILLGVSVISFFAQKGFAFVLNLLHLETVEYTIQAPTTNMQTIAYILAFCIVPAVVEEFFFRGAVLQSLRPYGDGFAIMLSAAFFALLHTSLYQMPNAFISGLVLGYFAVRGGNIFIPVIMHMVSNFVWSSSILFPTSHPFQELSQIGLMVLVLVCAFGSLLFLIKRRKNMFMLLPASSSLTYKAKAGTLLSVFPLFLAICIMVIRILSNIRIMP